MKDSRTDRKFGNSKFYYSFILMKSSVFKFRDTFSKKLHFDLSHFEKKVSMFPYNFIFYDCIANL